MMDGGGDEYQEEDTPSWDDRGEVVTWAGPRPTPPEPVGSRSSQDDEGARLPQMILEFNGKAVWKRRTAALCVWKCSSHGMLACLSVIYSREEMKPVCAPRFDGGGERL